MGKIKELPIDVVNQIAAGEVVERPASVVKELVDNCLDSGASEITVEIINGGEQLIKVIDNGTGMSAEDLPLTVVPHATSKLEDISDLLEIQTMGFRGEALASIAAVSKFKISSKYKDSDNALVLQQNETGDWETKPVALTAGTTVEVADLFYNVPARKKFLKKSTTEFNHIMNILTRLAMIYPEISWRLSHNAKESFFYPKVADLKERLSQILSSDIANDLLPINFESSNITLRGFVSAPNKWQSNRKHQYIFVNNRPVSNAIVNRALLDGIGHLLPPRNFPVYVLNLEMPGSEVDVNVHPRKSEVKFANDSMVFGAIRSTVQKIMNQSKMDMPFSSSVSSSVNWGQAPQRSASNFANSSAPQVKQSGFNLGSSAGATKANYQRLYEPIKMGDPKLEMADSGFVGEAPQKEIELSENWKYIGQIDKRFLVVEMTQSLLLIDQHALAEGILYNKLKKKFEENKTLAKQSLLIPADLEFTSWQVSLLDEFNEVLQELGFEIEPFGGNSYVLQAVPADVAANDPKTLVLDLLNDLALEEKGSDLEKKRDRVIKYTACRSAIKFGDQLTELEGKNLIQGMFDYSVHSCAHGRPVYWEVNYEDLLKKFQR